MNRKRIIEENSALPTSLVIDEIAYLEWIIEQRKTDLKIMQNLKTSLMCILINQCRDDIKCKKKILAEFKIVLESRKNL